MLGGGDCSPPGGMRCVLFGAESAHWGRVELPSDYSLHVMHLSSRRAETCPQLRVRSELWVQGGRGLYSRFLCRAPGADGVGFAAVVSLGFSVREFGKSGGGKYDYGGCGLSGRRRDERLAAHSGRAYSFVVALLLLGEIQPNEERVLKQLVARHLPNRFNPAIWKQAL